MIEKQLGKQRRSWTPPERPEKRLVLLDGQQGQA